MYKMLNNHNNLAKYEENLVQLTEQIKIKRKAENLLLNLFASADLH